MHARRVGDRVLSFGVSGNLWNDALVMYDRETGSLWSHVIGECIEGELEGTRLQAFDALMLPFREWAERFPESRVLVREEGDPDASRYQDYFRSPRQGIFGTQVKRQELEPKELVQGVVYEGEAAAIPHQALEDGASVSFSLAARRFEARRRGADIQVWRLGEKGAEERYPSTTAFWFGWVNFHPRSQVVQ